MEVFPLLVTSAAILPDGPGAITRGSATPAQAIRNSFELPPDHSQPPGTWIGRTREPVLKGIARRAGLTLDESRRRVISK